MMNIKIQEEGNIQKIKCCWVLENNIKLLSEYLKKHVKDIKFGLCHGTRRGKEQEWFKKYLNIKDLKIVGTEISKTATQFTDTIQWDFNDVKEEWINNADFIYSNSWDHSYKPIECLDSWMSCVKKSGVCLIEWTPSYIPVCALDPFGATQEEYEEIITKKYEIKDRIEGHGHKEMCIYFVISHKL